jgi:hypothetical protein
MGHPGPGSARRVLVKSYGRGSLLGVLGLMYAYLMARQGMRGWEASAVRAMEDDAVAMARKGYRIVTSEERGMRAFGIVYYRVTYERVDQPGQPA